MKKILLSIHDTTPFFAAEIDRICRTLDEMGATRRSLLIVPDHMRKTPLTEHRAWCREIAAQKDRGSDIGLHGIHHEYAECGFLSFERAKETLVRARGMFGDAFGFAPSGFVAPQWFQSAGCKRAVTELGFLYSGRWNGLFDARGKCLYHAFPVNFDWGFSWMDAFFSRFNPFCLTRKKEGVIRFSIHPMDVRHGLFDGEAGLLKRLLDDGWTCSSYGDAAKEMKK